MKTHWPQVKKAYDICDINAEDLPKAEVWCGGFPCQDISVASGKSKRLGLDGTRSGLFFQYAALIEQCMPEVVLIENVEGLFNSNGGRDFGVILQRLTSMGYAVSWRLLNSRYFGVPQSRPRVYMCCWKNSPQKAMRVMFDHEGAQKPTDERKGFISEAPGAIGYPKVPMVAYCLAATSGRHTGTDWSRTYVVCDDGVRRLTPKEYERLQGFPDGWTIPKGVNPDSDDVDTLRYTAVGNAVSVPVVEWIASRAYKELLVNRDDTATRDDLQSYVPEFAKSAWANISLATTDFSDTSTSYSWPKAGTAWDDTFIGGNVTPTPAAIIETFVIEIVEREHVGRKYYLTSNASEGVIRRVDNQGRRLFAPLRAALEIECNRKEHVNG